MIRLLPDRTVPFSRPARAPGEDEAVLRVLASGALVGGGVNTRSAQSKLEAMTGASRALLTSSGTSALEMACLLIDLQRGDEVILPSFTFSSCANAIALRGAVPVFVDIRQDTLNIDENLIEAAITARTKAIMPVHYAGISAEMDVIMAIAERNGLSVIEDAAQGVCARYRGKALGSMGTLGAFSFHASKNISCGEGGAILINDPAMAERAEILWEKGTNRNKFVRGEVDKYTWIDIGSSFLPSEITASLLLCQLENARDFTAQRVKVWNRYHKGLAGLEAEGLLQRPSLPPDHVEGNGHIYAVIMPTAEMRDHVLGQLNLRGISATFHYVPLHSAPAGMCLGRSHGLMVVTDDLSARLLRLPMYADIDEADQDHILASISEVCGYRGKIDV